MRLGIKTSICVLALFTAASIGHAATWYAAPGATGNGATPATPGNISSVFTNLANSGDVIELAGGIYTGSGGGTLSIQNKAATAGWTDNVVFRPASGQTATFASRLDVNADRVTFDGITAISPVFLQQGAIGYATVQNSTLSSTLFVRKHNSQVLNNNFLNGIGADAIQVGGRTGDNTYEQRSNNILIEGNYIRDYSNLPNDPQDVHEDGIQLFDTQNVIIRNNTITNVADANIIFSSGSNRGIRNVLIENNFLRTTDREGPHGDDNANFDGYGVFNLLQASDLYQNIQIVNNTIMADVHIGNTSQVLLRNNIIRRITAMGFLVQHDHNLVGAINSAAGSLDATDQMGSMPSFLDYATGDLHIAPGDMTNLAFGTMAGAPQYDIDGQFRTGPLWVGADQIGAPVPEPTACLLSVFAIAGAILGHRNRYC